jgi:hypothetical protein
MLPENRPPCNPTKNFHRNTVETVGRFIENPRGLMSSPLALLTIVLCLFAVPCPAGAAPKRKVAPKTRITPKVEPAAPNTQLDPALEPHAEHYEADLAALRTARVADLANRRAGYLAELDAAIAKIAAGADAALIGVLRKEREGIARGLVTPANPAGLPPEIQTARKRFFNRIEFASMTFAAEKKKLDAAYLKLLTTLGRQTKNDKPLAARIAAERRRVQTGL